MELHFYSQWFVAMNFALSRPRQLTLWLSQIQQLCVTHKISTAARQGDLQIDQLTASQFCRWLVSPGTSKT